MSDITFNILARYGKLGQGSYSPSLNYVAWNGIPKYDLRRWSSDELVPYKGLTLTKDELQNLYSILTKALVSPKDSTAKHVFKSGKINAKVIEIFGFVSEQGQMKKYVTYTDWGHGPKYDIRSWGNDFSSCGKGVTLNDSEIKTFLELVEKNNLVRNNLHQSDKSQFVNSCDDDDWSDGLFI